MGRPLDVKPGTGRIPETTEQATVSGLGLVLLGAVFLRNLPGSMTSAIGMRQEGRSTAYILLAWGLVAVACIGACVLGYAVLGGLPPALIGAVLALAAEDILAMLADTLMPEAFQNGGPWVAMATAVGFACAFLLARVTS